MLAVVVLIRHHLLDGAGFQVVSDPFQAAQVVAIYVDLHGGTVGEVVHISRAYLTATIRTPPVRINTRSVTVCARHWQERPDNRRLRVITTSRAETGEVQCRMVSIYCNYLALQCRKALVLRNCTLTHVPVSLSFAWTANRAGDGVGIRRIRAP